MTRSGLLVALLTLCLLLAVKAGAALAEDPPPPPAGDEDDEGPLTEEQRAARQRKLRQELEQRKHDLPAPAKRALKRLEEFRARDLRLWAVPRERILAEGLAAVPALLVMLEEFDWEVRAFAASCLEELRAPEALNPLLTALGKESYIEARRRMVRALAALQAPEAEAALTAAAQDTGPGVALAAVRGLGALSRPESIPTLQGFMKHKDPDVRYEALGSLAALGDAQARERLMKGARALVATRDLMRVASRSALDLQDRYEQYLLGVALARSGDKAIDSLLTKVLKADKPWNRKVFLRLGAAEGLGRRAAQGGTLHPGLLKGASHDDATVRVACSYGLGFVGSPEILKALKRARTDSQLDVRRNVMRALGRVGTAAAVKALHRSLRDRAPEVRAAAARALAETRIPEATAALLAAVKDKKYVIRVVAARALAHRTAEPNVVDALAKAAKDPDFGVRAQALASLARAVTRVDVALPALMGAIDDRDEGVRASACLGVSALLDGMVERPLLNKLFVRKVVQIATETSTERLRKAAAEMLDAQRPAAAVPQLITALSSKKEVIRRRANSLLQKMSEKNMNFDSEAPPAERTEAIRRWQAWWERTGTLPARDRHAGMVVTGALADQTRDLKWRGLDLVLLLDSTGSMAGLLNAAKQSIDEIIAEMSSALPSLRISLFTYRDFGDDYVYYATPLTFDVEHLPGFLQSFVHGQGGDIPEAVHDAVGAAMKRLQWRDGAHKVVIFAGDAPHHPELDRDFRADIKRWATRENRAVLHAIFTDTNRRSLDINRRKVREDPDAFGHPYLDIYRSIANEGRGRAAVLSDESALIKEILVLAFGPAWRADIENFLDFRN